MKTSPWYQRAFEEAMARRQARDRDEPVRALDAMSMAQLRVFLKGYPGDWRRDPDAAKGIPPPPATKPCPAGAPRIPLAGPATLDLGRMPFAEVINRRRSRTAYSAAALSRDALSYLLWCTQGVDRIVSDEPDEPEYTLRTVPSGGARHPFETYLVVNRVEDLAPGLYRFLPVEYELVALREATGLAQASVEICYGQPFVGKAAAVFIWTAVPARMEWRYAYLAHRMIAIEAGHVCQNLYLAAESIGAGACAILGYDQAGTDALLGVDGEDEFAIYLASVGMVE